MNNIGPISRDPTANLFTPSSVVLVKQASEALPMSDSLSSSGQGSEQQSTSCFASIGGCFISIFMGIYGVLKGIHFWFLENLCCCCCSQSSTRAMSLIQPLLDLVKNKREAELLELNLTIAWIYGKLSGAHQMELKKFYIERAFPSVEGEEIAPDEITARYSAAEQAFRAPTTEIIQIVINAFQDYHLPLKEKETK